MKYTGLSSKEAKLRLKEFGLNILSQNKYKKPFWLILLNQFSSPIILMLIAVAITSFALSAFHVAGSEEGFIDSILIFAIVIFSALAGFIQDYKSEKALEALQGMLSNKAKVYRDSKLCEIDVSEIVPGDILSLESGDIIPADLKALEVNSLEIDESSFTGESIAISKNTNEALFMNTLVNSGKAIAEVTATGSRTEIGKLAYKLEKPKETKDYFTIELETLTHKILIYLSILLIVIFL